MRNSSTFAPEQMELLSPNPYPPGTSQGINQTPCEGKLGLALLSTLNVLHGESESSWRTLY